MSTNDRLDQIRRRWDTEGKYHVPTDPAAAELHEIVGELLTEIDDLEDALGDDEGDSFDSFDADDRATLEQDHADDIRQLEKDHAERLGTLAPAIEDLHAQAHGHGTSLFMCPLLPCRDMYRLLPNAQGRVLAS